MLAPHDEHDDHAMSSAHNRAVEALRMTK